VDRVRSGGDEFRPDETVRESPAIRRAPSPRMRVFEEQARKEIEDKLLSEKNQKLIDDLNKRLLARAKIGIYRDRLGFNYVGSL
jgi:hypothetical protein